MDERKRVLWRSLFLTILIFAIGILLNHGLDVFRIATITDVMRVHEIDTAAYQTERFFTETFGGEQCEVMVARISDLKSEIRKVGEDLSAYSRFSFFRKKDYDYLKRKYFLLELKFFSLIQKLNRECDHPYLPILFFYKIDDKLSERQGFVLQDLSKDNEEKLIVLSLDKDYKDEPLVNLIVQYYNITSAPALIVDNQKYEGFVYLGQLNSTVQKFLRRADPYTEHDFMFTPEAAGVNVSRLVSQLELIASNSSDPFARADSLLIMGRLLKNDSVICSSLQYYDQVNSTNSEERAIVYETGASLGCGRNRKAFLRAAADEWQKVGNLPRAKLLRNIAEGKRQRLIFDENAIKSNITVISGYNTPITPVLQPANISEFIIGNTKIVLDSSSIIISQDDRVYRDWLSGQLQNPFRGDILVTFSERLTYNQSELLPEIGWHEGARVRDLKKINLTHIPAVGTLVARHGDRWFASDDKGIFRFEVPIDKLLYPTTRFLRRDLAVIIDTHGVNMLVEQAIRNKVSAVISDCDHPGKVYAAYYLNQHNIPVACFPDKYVYLALGHNLSLVGSPPTAIVNNTAVIGGRPLKFSTKEKIVAVNSTLDAYALWYYQTPASYMEVLQNSLNLNVTYVTLDNFGEMSKATDKAREINATVLATRVFNSNDYAEVKKWLDEDEQHKVIVFHTASYPYGQKILLEPRVTFDDPNPVFT